MGKIEIQQGRIAGITQTELAEIYRVPQPTVAGWKRSGVDIYSPVEVAKHVAQAGRKPETWAGVSDVPEEGECSKEEKLRQEIRKLKLDADKSERMLEILDGDYLPRPVVEEREAAIGYVVNALMRAICSETPPLTAGLDQAATEKRLREWSQPWAEKIKNAQDDVWKEAERAIQRELRGDLKRVAVANSKRADG